ncbi:nitrous oxide-stimulated promoter family protein [Treponema sp.]|uniref:nitrous oxide-stimulated promoter family protein n=1 Tax=Treponema sp. TaxID=166 RepID=UPI00298E9D1B|nr:nitrous oxide-stimulated promoter family protein [Treponema sp.]MCR5612732.1 nitrous oxide-stimulated promoter family protein [Treponema sp.]
MEINKKRQKEWNTVLLMIEIYCRGNHKNKHALKEKGCLCNECKELSEYVHERITKCPLMKEKTFCSMCHVHCYKKEYREQIRKVMRYSGVRMLKYHPILALKHVVLTLSQKIKFSNKNSSTLKASGCPCAKYRWLCSVLFTLLIICLILALPVWSFQIEGTVESSSIESSVSVVTVTTKKCPLKKDEKKTIQKKENTISKEIEKPQEEKQEEPSSQNENASISENISNETSLSDSDKQGIANYKSYALGRIASKKTYPLSARSQGQQGKVKARIVINPDGTLQSAEIIQKCEFESLNEACLDAIKRASPFKKMSVAFPMTLTFVMDFSLN